MQQLEAISVKLSELAAKLSERAAAAASEPAVAAYLDDAASKLWLAIASLDKAEDCRE